MPKKLKKSSSKANSSLYSSPEQFLAVSNADKVIMENFRKKERIDVFGSELNWMPLSTFKESGFSSDLLAVTKV